MTSPSNTPQCVAFIMDGNRRWAKERGLSPWEGHVAGQKKFKEFLGWAHAAGINNAIAYAFSTENWKRSVEEVDHILNLARSFFEEEISELVENKIRVRFAGDITQFPPDIQKMIADAEQKTRGFTSQTVMIAAPYGGRAEIVAATKSLITQGITDVDESTIAHALWTKDFPDPDLLIRTGGEKRLSNFLPWQSTYSELFFTDTLWPDFSESEFHTMLADYQSRKRNFGA